MSDLSENTQLKCIVRGGVDDGHLEFTGYLAPQFVFIYAPIHMLKSKVFL